MKLEECVGKQLMVGIQGSEVTPAMIHLLEEIHAGGLIVYRPNFASAQAFKSLILELEEALGRRLLVAVDNEGGRVIHLAEGVTVFPDNLALGRTGNGDYARCQGETEAMELRRLGIDLNLAPTLDVLTDTYSPNIGIRSYAKDPDLVAKLGVARIKAMQAGGLSACAKHFPGQGQSPWDAHLALPVLSTTWEEMKKIHINPFLKAIRAGVDAVMSSHPVYPSLDSTPMLPATFSRRIIHDGLREELNFGGVILSDDLEMGALKEICSIGEAACRAVEAGHDMLLVCHREAAQREVYQALLRGYEDRRLNPLELEKSVERIERLKMKRPQRFEGGEPHAERAGSQLAQKIAKEAISGNQVRMIDFMTRDVLSSVGVIFPRFSELSHQILVEETMLDERVFVERIFGKFGLQPRAIEIIGLDPSQREIERSLASAQQCEITFFFCYDAHFYPRARKLLELLQNRVRNCIVISLRDPYDQEFAEKNAVWVMAFGFREVQIRAALDSIFSHAMNVIPS